jgi:hypothetical protein
MRNQVSFWGRMDPFWRGIAGRIEAILKGLKTPLAVTGLAVNVALRKYVQDRLAGMVVTPKGTAIAFGLLERSSTWTSAGSAMGIGLESGANCSSPTARLSPR